MKNIFLVFFAVVYMNALSQETVKQDPIYDVKGLDIKPEFTGGEANFLTYVKNKISVPPTAKGKIYVTFIVEKNGELSDIKVLKDVGHGSGEETLRALKESPTWSPGKQDNAVVRTLLSFAIPINEKDRFKPLKK